MALIFPGSLCALCGKPLSAPIFATSGVFLPLNDPLVRYCDDGMHWDCYAAWEHREKFARAYVQMWIEHEKESLYWARVFQDEHCFITINPRPPVNRAHITLFSTGSRIEVPLQQWEKWIWERELPPAVHPLERDALKEALPAIRMAFPTVTLLLEAADWSSKKELEEKNHLREQRRLELVAGYNQRCGQLNERLGSGGLTCPHCHEHTKKIRFYDKAPESKSYFVCQLCARSFRPEDIGKQVHCFAERPPNAIWTGPADRGSGGMSRLLGNWQRVRGTHLVLTLVNRLRSFRKGFRIRNPV